jgi:hypothetical protein
MVYKTPNTLYQLLKPRDASKASEGKGLAKNDGKR